MQNGLTALMIAAGRGHRDVVALLLDRRADMEAKLRVSGPFHPLRAAGVIMRQRVGSMPHRRSRADRWASGLAD